MILSVSFTRENTFRYVYADESDSFNLCELMIVFPVQIYYNYGYKEPFFVTFYICRRKCHD